MELKAANDNPNELESARHLMKIARMLEPTQVRYWIEELERISHQYEVEFKNENDCETASKTALRNTAYLHGFHYYSVAVVQAHLETLKAEFPELREPSVPEREALTFQQAVQIAYPGNQLGQ